ncbi:hypothetical protein [Marinobacter sp. BGYM27]|uniref:hypothetical protein n=1 Tax=unclassified Marinobacter TaxID=83889 RepID=UPI0021A4F063|nr:hypothetical protein [Marinobacter sp. BGYM27]MDG5500042.1 hypothetical protein [Marinobacter sp. BGYM27]|tara:strand:+ start:368 stop:529 length:162 start_codon:yes stop_codon:yes gene_type:complete
MRLSDLTVRFRRNRVVMPEHSRVEAVERRQTLSLEALNRPAQSRSLKAALRQR